MTVHLQTEHVTLYAGDCLDVLRELPDASVDAVVTDPPYLLGFMGRAWDTRAAHEHLEWHGAWCEQAFRVLKPGGHMLAFGGTRTWHRLACAVEDAGFEIRDSIAWMYGSGFPKSLDVSKAIDKAVGAEREVIGAGAFASRRPASRRVSDGGSPVGEAALHYGDGHNITAPATPDAERWQGWGTALKPAFEPIVVARKPLAGTVAQNVLAHGTGALNIDGCRVEHASDADLATSLAKNPGRSDSVTSGVYGAGRPQQRVNTAGRWPANVVLDESQAAVLDEQSGETISKSGGTTTRLGTGGIMNPAPPGTPDRTGHDDAGGASRFFYVAKADASERVRVNGTAHPTVKPLELMRWLVRLVTPPGGTVLEPFAGSGTTVEACLLEGFSCIAIEREPDYLPLIVQRINRRRDPVAAVKATEADGGLFDLLGEETA